MDGFWQIYHRLPPSLEEMALPHVKLPLASVLVSCSLLHLPARSNTIELQQRTQ
jgi:hypothetical protein